MKSLEFWNFEKVHVDKQKDGEMKMIHQNWNYIVHIQLRVVDCSTVLGSQAEQGIILSEDLLRDIK
ncbi:hypothetical protein E2C01_043455 [Portunus trituberculatus]|uniref:Uncharacterized protein n=1 Tax=Portunus trituberculatus TaxID=210409 RepID=A0A5B7FVT0_PORTR|nr:hypothetical protein [Portunus trituberculatus]